MTAPFVTIAPAIPGAFRWSGTTTLVYTPDPKRPLPFATSYTVTVDDDRHRRQRTHAGGARDASPSRRRRCRLLSTSWYRRGDTVDGAMVFLLRFNQPVRRADIAAHLSASLARHEWDPPSFTSDERARYLAQDPAGLAAFEAKVAAVSGIAAGGAPVRIRLTTQWDKQRYPEAADLVVFESVSTIAARESRAAGAERPRALAGRSGHAGPGADLHGRGGAGLLRRGLPLPDGLLRRCLQSAPAARAGPRGRLRGGRSAHSTSPARRSR